MMFLLSLRKLNPSLNRRIVLNKNYKKQLYIYLTICYNYLHKIQKDKRDLTDHYISIMVHTQWFH